jgi:hypothetical protein
VIALVAALALAGADAPADPGPDAPVANAEQPAAPEKVKYTKWQEAATASGLVSFVGLVIGGVAVPGAVGLIANAAGAPLPNDALLGAAVVGGSLGAAAGGVIGALPTTEWYGVPIVAGAGAVGSLVGLVPSFIFGHLAYEDPDHADALVPFQSASLVAGMIGAGGAAALAGGLFALPDEGPEKVNAHTVETTAVPVPAPAAPAPAAPPG